eukprot:gene78-231_t
MDLKKSALCALGAFFACLWGGRDTKRPFDDCLKLASTTLDVGYRKELIDAVRTLEKQLLSNNIIVPRKLAQQLELLSIVILKYHSRTCPACHAIKGLNAASSRSREVTVLMEGPVFKTGRLELKQCSKCQVLVGPHYYYRDSESE